jgi:hypothetical protein
MRGVTILWSLALSLTYVPVALSQGAVPSASNPAGNAVVVPNSAESAASQAQAQLNAWKGLAGPNFGIGVAANIDLGKSDRITEADIVSGNRIAVKKERNDFARVLFEAHYFFTPPDTKILGTYYNCAIQCDASRPRDFGFGPFVAVQPSQNEIIDAIAFGLMVGFKQPAVGTSGSSWNFGVGAIIDPSVKTLAPGFRGGQPLPAGETQIRFTERSEWGLILMSSFSF